jgi:hypothetical protein
VCAFAGVFVGVTCGFAGAVTAVVTAGCVVTVFEPFEKSIMLAPRPSAATSPTRATMRICGLRVMFTARLSPQSQAVS